MPVKISGRRWSRPSHIPESCSESQCSDFFRIVPSASGFLGHGAWHGWAHPPGSRTWKTISSSGTLLVIRFPWSCSFATGPWRMSIQSDWLYADVANAMLANRRTSTVSRGPVPGICPPLAAWLCRLGAGLHRPAPGDQAPWDLPPCRPAQRSRWKRFSRSRT